MLAQAEITAYAQAVRQAAEGREAREEQWERLRRRLASHPGNRTLLVTRLLQQYEEATHTCFGCD
jgi:hypothetical protein